MSGRMKAPLPFLEHLFRKTGQLKKVFFCTFAGLKCECAEMKVLKAFILPVLPLAAFHRVRNTLLCEQCHCFFFLPPCWQGLAIMMAVCWQNYSLIYSRVRGLPDFQELYCHIDRA